jgi:hypothetical protein
MSSTVESKGVAARRMPRGLPAGQVILLQPQRVTSGITLSAVGSVELSFSVLLVCCVHPFLRPLCVYPLVHAWSSPSIHQTGINVYRRAPTG